MGNQKKHIRIKKENVLQNVQKLHHCYSNRFA